MLASSVPGRITIDFRGSIHPAKAWIIGIAGDPDRVELLAFEAEPEVATRVAPARATHTPRQRPIDGAATALAAGCTCPDFCERDHANE